MLRHVRHALQLGQNCEKSACVLSRLYGTLGPGKDSEVTRIEDEPKKLPRVARPSEAGTYKNPWYLLSEELKNAYTRTEEDQVDPIPVPRETDLLVIGGGAIGSSVAYWLKERNPEAFQASVVERDPTYTRAATVLSVGGIRQQFSLKENIEMSLFGAEFLRDIKEHLSVYGIDPPDVQFNPQGYLFLASEAGAETLHANHRLQTELGAKIRLMTKADLQDKFPWLNTEDLACGAYGLQNEGWFDPWLLLCALRRKATSLGANYIKGEVVGFNYRDIRTSTGHQTTTIRKRLSCAMVKHDNGETYPIKFAACINCAGPWSGEVAAMAGIGTGEGALSIPLPVEPRKRYVFMFHCPDGPGLETPMVVDTTGAYFRREGLGGHYICGASPPAGKEPSIENLDVDYSIFNDELWPVLANRVPSFEALKLKSAWAGFYDYNYVDQNLIIGNHPHHLNFLFATGCSGHGIQQSPAIGRAIAELILDDEFQSIDLRRFCFDRFLEDEPIFESNIV